MVNAGSSGARRSRSRNHYPRRGQVKATNPAARHAGRPQSYETGLTTDAAARCRSIRKRRCSNVSCSTIEMHPVCRLGGQRRSILRELTPSYSGFLTKCSARRSAQRCTAGMTKQPTPVFAGPIPERGVAPLPGVEEHSRRSKRAYNGRLFGFLRGLSDRRRAAFESQVRR